MQILLWVMQLSRHIFSDMNSFFSPPQKVMCLGFDWNSHEMSVMFLAKLAKPLIGTCRIVINSIHIKGDVCSLLFPLCFVTLLIM